MVVALGAIVDGVCFAPLPLSLAAALPLAGAGEGRTEFAAPFVVAVSETGRDLGGALGNSFGVRMMTIATNTSARIVRLSIAGETGQGTGS